MEAAGIRPELWGALFKKLSNEVGFFYLLLP